MRRLSAKLRTSSDLIKDVLYANHCDIVTHMEEDMQNLKNAISMAYEVLGLTISLTKIVAMFPPVLGMPYIEPGIFVYGRKLAVVSKFVYLAITLNTSMNLKVNLRVN